MRAITTTALSTHLGRETGEAKRAFEELVGWMASPQARWLPLPEAARIEEEQIGEVAQLLLQEPINARGPTQEAGEVRRTGRS